MERARRRLLHVFPTFAPGGAQVRATDLMNAFGARFEHAVVALDGVTSALERVRGDIVVRALRAPPKAGTFATARRLVALLRRERPELLLTYNFGAIDALLAARLVGGLRAVHHEDGFHADEAHGLKRRRTWLRRLALPACDRLVVISRNLERIALQVWRQPRERVLYIANGIDTSRFEPRASSAAGDLRRALGIAPHSTVFGSVGHLRPEKNVGRLLRAARLCAESGVDLSLLILGDGPERAALEELARAPALSGRVHFVGFQADPRAHYAAMDALCLPSDTEQMPMALIEAMASALPAACTDVGDVRAMLPAAQHDFLVPLGPQSEAELARAMGRLAADPALRRSLGQANRASATERFDRGAMIAAYADLYGGLAGGSI